MKDKSIIVTVSLFVALVFMIIGFEGSRKELKEQQEAYTELQNEYTYLKFNGADVQNCPLCGSENTGLERGASKYWVTCKECGIQGSYCETVQEAVDVWNSLKKVKGM